MDVFFHQTYHVFYTLNPYTYCVTYLNNKDCIFLIKIKNDNLKKKYSVKSL